MFVFFALLAVVAGRTDFVLEDLVAETESTASALFFSAAVSAKAALGLFCSGVAPCLLRFFFFFWDSWEDPSLPLFGDCDSWEQAEAFPFFPCDASFSSAAAAAAAAADCHGHRQKKTNHYRSLQTPFVVHNWHLLSQDFS